MLHFHLSTTPICSKIHFIIEGLTRISQVFSLQKTIRISPIQRHHYITSSYTYLFFKVFLFLIAVSLWTGRFRKPTFNSLYDPFGSPCRGQKPSLPLRKAPLFSPSLSSMVFTPPSVPPFPVDRNLRNERM